jgi:hypothetical protein
VIAIGLSFVRDHIDCDLVAVMDSDGRDAFRIPRLRLGRLCTMAELGVNFAAALIKSRIPIFYVPCVRRDRYDGVTSQSFVNLIVHRKTPAPETPAIDDGEEARYDVIDAALPASRLAASVLELPSSRQG